MIPGRAPSPIDKLAVAVVHEPVRAVNSSLPAGAREEALRFLLQTAADAGVTLVATKPEGDGERRLGLPRGDTLLVSCAGDLAGAEGRALWDRLEGLKTRGLFRRIGIRVDLEDGPALLARRFQPDVVELPLNLLDQRAQHTGVLSELAALNVAVHATSVFADGLLFISGEPLPPEMAGHAHALSRIRRRLAEARIDPMQATLAYVMGLPEVSAVVASVASAAELRAVVAAANVSTPALDWAALQLEPATAAAAGPRRVSSAA